MATREREKSFLKSYSDFIDYSYEDIYLEAIIKIKQEKEKIIMGEKFPG